MTDLESVRQRFLHEEPTKRLGHLAADLLRIANFIETGSHNAAIPIIRESKFMAEWAAPDSDPETQGLLSETQSFLAFKELQWSQWISDEAEVQQTALTIRSWSDEFLKRTGLLNP